MINWEIFAAMVGLGGLFITIGGIVFLSGGQKQILNTLGKRVDEHSIDIKMLSDTSAKHELKLALIDQWKQGFHAAAETTHRSREGS